MKYYRLKIGLRNYEDRLNRTILFKYDSDLNELAFTVLSIFNTWHIIYICLKTMKSI